MTVVPPRIARIRFTLRRAMGLMVIVTLALWIARAFWLAILDNQRVDHQPSLHTILFFYRRLWGLDARVYGLRVMETYDWHDRWDLYIAGGLVVTLTAVALRRWGGRSRRHVLIVSAIAIVAGLIWGRWVIASNRAFHVRGLAWVIQNERAASGRIVGGVRVAKPNYHPENDPYAHRRMAVRRAHERVLNLPWYTLLLPRARPEILWLESS